MGDANKAATAALKAGAVAGALAAKNGIIEAKNKTKNKNKNTDIKLKFSDNIGKLIDPDTVAREKGYANYDELMKYKQENPELYNAMGGVKYGHVEGSVLEKRVFEIGSLQSKAKEKIIERISSSNIDELQKAISELNSTEWKDAKIAKKYGEKISAYVDDWIALESIGYFKHLSENERKNYVAVLRKIKEDAEGKTFLYTNFNNINEYNAFIMNNTAELENGMKPESITARVKAYEAGAARLNIVKTEISNMSEEEKWTKKASSGSGRMIYSTNVETENTKHY